jgi:hypothetical protein
MNVHETLSIVPPFAGSEVQYIKIRE